MNGGIMHLSIILLVKRGIVFQLDKIISALRQKRKCLLFVHNTMLGSLCSDDKVTASTVSPCSCLPLPRKGTGLGEDSWPTLRKREVEDLTTNLWCWCEGAFCRWLNAASVGIRAHPSLLNICALPLVTPEVLLSPVLQGRFFISSQIY